MDAAPAAPTADAYYEIRLASGPPHSSASIVLGAALGSAPRRSTIKLFVEVVRIADGEVVQSYDYRDATEAAIHVASLRERAARLSKADFESDVALVQWAPFEPRAEASYAVEVHDAGRLHRLVGRRRVVQVLRRSDGRSVKSYHFPSDADARWRVQLLREQLASMSSPEFETEHYILR